MASVYVPPNLGNDGGATCSGGCASDGQIAYEYIRAYLNAHMLSKPSWRYFYILWFVLTALLLLSSAAHFCGLGDRTYIGAVWSKWATKNRVVKLGKKHTLEPVAERDVQHGRAPQYAHLRGQASSEAYSGLIASGMPVGAQPAKRTIIMFPSFGRMIVLALMLFVPAALSLIGADYINPNSPIFDIRQSFPNGTVTPANIGTFRRRSGSSAGAVIASVSHLARRKLHWGQGAFPPVTTLPINVTLPYRTWWTIGGRLGGMTNALTPFVLILALKQVPFALLSFKIFGGFGFDRLSFLHKWGGRIVWLFASLHFVTWGVQLGIDTALGGRSLWSLAILWPRFRWGIVSYIFLTLLVALSIGPIRRKHYELFYVSHIVCIIGFMVAAWLHHPPLGPWMYAALLWWAAERVTRAAKIAWINGLGFVGPKPRFVPGAAPPPQKRPSFPAPRHGASYSYQKAEQFRYPPTQPTQQQQQQQQRQLSQSSGQHAQYASAHSFSSSTATAVSSPPFSPPYGSFQSQQTMGSAYSHSETGSHGQSDPLSRFAAESEAAEYGYALGHPEDHKPQQGHQQLWHANGGSLPHSPSRHGFLGVQLEDAPASRNGPIAHQDIATYPESEHTYAPSSGSSADLYAMHRPQGQRHPPQSALRSSASTAYSSAGSSGAAPPYDFAAPGAAFGEFSRGQQLAPQYRRSPRPTISPEIAAALQPGYAFVQVLPGKTLRLTIRTPHHISWLPGQFVNLQIPHVRCWESHPFTIAAAYDGTHSDVMQPADPEKGVDSKKGGEQRTIVLIVRARSGFTKQLYEYAQQERRQQLGATLHAQAGITKTSTGVHMRAIVDGPYGSSKRVDWGSHSSVVIVCAGSGVSFGMAILEHLCQTIAAQGAGSSTKRGRAFHVKKVRFVWMLREFSHLQWVASSLRRCIEMIPPEQLQVDLYVTHFNNRSTVVPPAIMPAEQHPQASQRGRRDSWGDALDSLSNSPAPSPLRAPISLPRQIRFTEGPEQEEYQITANDLTTFDGEDESHLHPMEMQINNRIQQEGKLRRANTRKVTMKRKGGRGQANGKGQESQAMASQRAVYEGWASTGNRAPMGPVPEKKTKDSGRSWLSLPTSKGSPGNSPLPSRAASPAPPSFVSHSDGMRSETHLMMGECPPMDDTCPIDLDEQEDQDMRVLAELARPGHPKLDRIIREEIERSLGRTLVTCCGPTSLSTVIRSIVSKSIDPKRIRQGDLRGYVNVVSESYEWGG